MPPQDRQQQKQRDAILRLHAVAKKQLESHWPEEIWTTEDNARIVDERIKAEKFAQQAAKRRKKYALQKIQREAFTIILGLIKERKLKITPEYMASITDPKMKQQLIEAVCLSKV
jgi:hypothetical protein